MVKIKLNHWSFPQKQCESLACAGHGGVQPATRRVGREAEALRIVDDRNMRPLAALRFVYGDRIGEVPPRHGGIVSRLGEFLVSVMFIEQVAANFESGDFVGGLRRFFMRYG